MTEPLAFLDVDTQVDFMLPSGSLYVPGAQLILPNLRKLMACAQERGIPMISSADAHSPDDPSFSEWPPHCVVGTPGQRRIPEILLSSAVVVPNRPNAFHPDKSLEGQIIVEKQEYDVSTNANFEAILAWLGPRHFVVFGVATEYCVFSSVRALRKRDLPVDLGVDAVRAITEEGGRRAVEEMSASGVRLVRTAEVCGSAAHLAA